MLRVRIELWRVRLLWSCILVLGLAQSADLAHAVATRRAVVSYLVTGTQDSNVAIPEEGMPSSRLAPHVWQWRVFDPAIRRDTLMFSLSSFPTHIQWDLAFDSVQFVLSNQIVRAAWRAGAAVVPEAVLPTESSLCTFWRDAENRSWHVITQREVQSPMGEGRVRVLQIATRWVLATSGDWHVGVIDSAEDANGGCFDSGRLSRGTRPARTVTISSMLDSMRISARPYSVMRELGAGEDDDRLAYVPSEEDSSAGVEVRVGFGDSEHAMEPVVWVNHSRGTRTTVYRRGDSRDDAFGQIGLRESRGLLLISAESSGAYPTVVDLHSGNVLSRINRPSARAVWVPAPR